MTGEDLREWRKRNRYRQADLQRELQIGSRATISAWENTEGQLPRMVELALIALERLPDTRMIAGFEPRSGHGV